LNAAKIGSVTGPYTPGRGEPAILLR